MQSEVNLTITIDHDENLPLDAQGIALLTAKVVTAAVFADAGKYPLSDPVTFGRVTMIGESPGVRVFLRSAFVSATREDGVEAASGFIADGSQMSAITEAR